tara:strand:+ start:32998 stop:34287 length:1290 start_codon:yes stop_codon:yes gene_type:complete
MNARDFKNRHDKEFINSLQKFNLFENSSNKEFLLSLLDYWLYSVSALHFSYDKESLSKFSASPINNPIRWSFSYEFGTDSEIQNRLLGLNFFSIGLSLLLKVHLPGGPLSKMLDKFILKISVLLVTHIPIRIDKSKSELVKRFVSHYFENMKINVDEKLIQKIPGVFQSKTFKLFSNFPLKVSCSPHAFMDFIGFEKIFLLNKKIIVEGFQHGGGYGLFETDYYSLYEKDLSNKFFGWGFLEDNIKQSKYKKTNLKIGKKRLVWLERPCFPKTLKLLNEGQYIQYKSPEVLSSISKSLRSIEGDYFNLTYPGSYKSEDYEGYRGKIINRENVNAEDIIALDDIVILDCSAASIIHFLVLNSISFILILDRRSEPFFTSKHAEWIALLMENGLCFFENQIDEIQHSITHLLSDSYILPEIIEEKHKIFFL